MGKLYVREVFSLGESSNFKKLESSCFGEVFIC